MTDEKRPASELFVEAFRAGIGTTEAICELCGRHVFASGPQTLGYNEGELERLQESAKQRPEKYVEWGDCDGISLGRIDGRQFVIGCCPENLRRYEDWILEHRRKIAEYLKARAKERLEDAQRDAEAVEGL